MSRVSKSVNDRLAFDETPLAVPASARLSARDAVSNLRVLSLTGGGYRGLFTAQVLVSLCEQAASTGPLSRSVDVFAGTSIGGLLACALAVGVTPRRVLEAIDAHGPRVFPRKRAATWRRLFFGNLYDRSNLEAAVREVLGPHADRPLSDVSTGLVVPAVDWESATVRVFMSRAFGKAHTCDARLVDVCLATSAAPTYFGGHKVAGRAMLDGGLLANNPDVMALFEVVRRWPHRMGRVQMLSIGTAGMIPTRMADDADAAGLQMGLQLPAFMIDAQERTASQQASRMLGTRYLRINHEASHPSAAFTRLDLATPDAREQLLHAAVLTAEQAYRNHRSFVDRMLVSRSKVL